MSQVPNSYKPKTIVDQPVPLLNGSMSEASGSDSDSGGLVQKSIPNIKVPKAVIATQVISQSLDSQAREIKGNYTFGQMGAIQIGTSTNGVKISPDGVLGTHGGTDKFTLTTDGNATFAGTIAAGAVISANISATQITGQIVNAQIANIDYGKINNVSIGSAEIQDGAITNAKIANAAITDAKISNLSASKITTGTLSVGGVGQVATITLAQSGSDGFLRWSGGSKIWADGNNYLGLTTTGGRTYFYSNGTLMMYLELGNGSNINGGFTVHGGLHVDNDLHVDGALADSLDCGGKYLNNIDHVNANVGNMGTINNTTLNGNWIGYWTLHNYSDERLKKNISIRTNNLADVMKLQPKEFKYKADKTNKVRIGFMAGEVEKILPNLVTKDDKGIKGIDLTEMIPVLVGAVQELKEEVELLKKSKV